MKFFEMKITGVAIDPSNQAPMVILKDMDGKNVLPIWVGIAEAAAVLTELEDIEIERPMTHDLAKNIISSLDAKVEKVAVVDVRDNIYYATITVRKTSGEVLEIDSRPSDAIALAMRFGVPILVAENVLSKSRIVDLTVEDVLAKSSEELMEILENFSDEDFGKYKM